MKKYEFREYELSEVAFDVYSNSDFVFYKDNDDVFYMTDNSHSEPYLVGSLADVDTVLLYFMLRSDNQWLVGYTYIMAVNIQLVVKK